MSPAGWVLLVLVVLLAGVRLALPAIVQNYVNRELSSSPDYAGHVGNVSIHLWRGAYEIQNVQIFKRNGRIKQPFFSADDMDLLD